MTRTGRNTAIAGPVGLVAAGLGWSLGPTAIYGGWLAALTLFATWPPGSMAILMIHALTGGRWGEALRPALRTGVWTLPLPRLQRSRRVVMVVACLLMAMAVLRSWWTVLPALGRGVDWIAITCMVGLGGVALSFALWATGNTTVSEGDRR